jgi:hypothetical protein
VTPEQRKLIELIAGDPAPKTTERLPECVEISEIYYAMKHAGADEYEGFPAPWEEITNEGLATLNKIAKEMLS